MLVADVVNALEVPIRRGDGPEGCADDWLEDNSSHGLRLGGLDCRGELGQELVGRSEGVGPRESGAVGVRGAEVPEAPEPAFVRPAERLPPGQVEGAEGIAVVAPPSRQNNPAVLLASCEVVSTHELEGRLNGLRSA